MVHHLSRVGCRADGWEGVSGAPVASISGAAGSEAAFRTSGRVGGFSAAVSGVERNLVRRIPLAWLSELSTVKSFRYDVDLKHIRRHRRTAVHLRCLTERLRIGGSQLCWEVKERRGRFLVEGGPV
jgi:hypothetical protein